MNFSFEKRQDRKTPVLLSLGIHVVLIALIASITFTYPIASFFDREVTAPTERIQYVRVQPAAGPAGEPGGAAPTKAREKKVETPAPLLAPAVTPSALPPIPAPSPAAGGGTGTGTGTGGGGTGLATGVEPALPDPRIELRPNSLRMPLSVAQRNDSAVKAIYMAYREAEIEAASRQGRSPRDWTFEKNGQKYGLDSSYIYLGKFKLPSAILAALPFNFGGVDGRRIIEGRNSAWIQNDIYTHSQGLSEDDFRSAVRRIRERKEKEKKEAEEAKRPGIVP
jgi:hypothetical protein